MNHESCAGCRYFRPLPGPADRGECRIHPPRVSKDLGAEWPAVRSSDWCGKFTPALKPREVVER